MVYSPHDLVHALLEGAEASDLVGLYGQVEGPYTLGTMEEMGWRKAFQEPPPGSVMALFANRESQDEVTVLTDKIINGLDPIHQIKADGETRYFGLYGGVKFMVNLADRSVSCDTGDRFFIIGLARGQH